MTTAPLRRVCIVHHVGSEDERLVRFYSRAVDAIVDRHADRAFDVRITSSRPNSLPLAEELRVALRRRGNVHSVRLEEVPNAGCDVAPFLRFLLEESDGALYDFILKIHTKSKLPWAQQLLLVFESLDSLDVGPAGTGIVGHAGHVACYTLGVRTQGYLLALNALLTDFGFAPGELYAGHLPSAERPASASELLFVAGTIFAMSGAAAAACRERFGYKLRVYVDAMEKHEQGYVEDEEGCAFRLTHAFERALCLLVQKAGFHVRGATELGMASWTSLTE